MMVYQHWNGRYSVAGEATVTTIALWDIPRDRRLCCYCTCIIDKGDDYVHLGEGAGIIIAHRVCRERQQSYQHSGTLGYGDDAL